MVFPTVLENQSVFRFPATLAAPALARMATAGALDGAYKPAAETSVLLVSELVTNSVRHAGLTPDQQVEMRITRLPNRVKFEIVDSGAGFEARPRRREIDDVGGWGLYLLEQLSSRWGVRTGPTTAWFELRVPDAFPTGSDPERN